MVCNKDGSGCKICPGMWIAGVLILVMIIQSWFARTPASPQVPSDDTVVAAGQPETQQPMQN